MQVYKIKTHTCGQRAF